MGEVKDTVQGKGLKDKDLPSPPPPAPAPVAASEEKQSFATRFMRSLRMTFGRQGLTDRIVKNAPVSAGPVTGDNLVDLLGSLCEEVSGLVEKKDDDTYAEGEALRAENTRKAGQLRAVHSLLTAAKNILEDY